MTQKLLTFSVASYNIERYLDKLMQTVVCDATKERIEVLIVNDGSKDRTAEMALEYEKAYPGTVRLVDKENGGHGSTINRGMQEAKGKYFRALDGDDWVDTEALVKLLDQLETLETDVVLMDFNRCFEGAGTERVSFPQLKDGNTYDFDEIADKIDFMYYHSVIYRTAFLQEHQIRLQEKCFYVDTEFMIYPVPHVKRLTYLALPLYCYRIGISEQSVSAAGRIKHIADSDRVAHNLLAFYQSLPADLSAAKRAYIGNGMALNFVFHINSLLMFDASKEKKKEIKAFEKQIKASSPEAYARMSKNAKTIWALRKSGYLLYGPLCRYKKKKGT
jgi:glycosyltransferase involved in cell wall biosynthesis